MVTLLFEPHICAALAVGSALRWLPPPNTVCGASFLSVRWRKRSPAATLCACSIIYVRDLRHNHREFDEHKRRAPEIMMVTAKTIRHIIVILRESNKTYAHTTTTTQCHPRARHIPHTRAKCECQHHYCTRESRCIVMPGALADGRARACSRWHQASGCRCRHPHICRSSSSSPLPSPTSSSSSLSSSSAVCVFACTVFAFGLLQHAQQNPIKLRMN